MISSDELIQEQRKTIQEMRDALKAAYGAFCTPVMRRKLDPIWNEYMEDAHIRIFKAKDL